VLKGYNAPMPRGQNLDRVRGSKEELAARWGLEVLGPGEAGRRVYIRAPEAVLEALERLPAKQRGEVVRAGLEALGLLEGED